MSTEFTIQLTGTVPRIVELKRAADELRQQIDGVVSRSADRPLLAYVAKGKYEDTHADVLLLWFDGFAARHPEITITVAQQRDDMYCLTMLRLYSCGRRTSESWEDGTEILETSGREVVRAFADFPLLAADSAMIEVPKARLSQNIAARSAPTCLGAGGLRTMELLL